MWTATKLSPRHCHHRHSTVLVVSHWFPKTIVTHDATVYPLFPIGAQLWSTARASPVPGTCLRCLPSSRKPAACSSTPWPCEWALCRRQAVCSMVSTEATCSPLAGKHRSIQSLTPGDLWVCFNIKTIFTGIGIPFIKTRWSWEQLIFIMGITYLVTAVFL